MHSVGELLEWLHPVDFAVLAHGWAKHGRDYLVVVQTVFGPDPGTHEVAFSHCVRLGYETRVRDDVWPISWTDEFLDYQEWLDAGEPSGYVWGTLWSNAYPGLAAVVDSAVAGEWTRRLNRPMSEVRLETDRFELRLVFHAVRWRKLSDDTGTIAQVIVPIDP
ncbi:MAG TPA: hypothetical protein VNA20_14355 [Frankiaceae bacterium]|nr:hypothetical protein [Frankiaceae bacterium]